MPERNPHPGSCEVPNETRRNLLGRQGDDSHAFGSRGQELEIRRLRPADHRAIVHTRPFGREERPLVMHPDHTRVELGRGIDRAAGSAHLLRRVAEHRREQCRRSETPVRRGNCKDCPRARVVVEQQAAAAVDLRIDESRRQPGAVRQMTNRNAVGQFGAGHDSADNGSVDHRRVVAKNRLAVEQMIGRDRELHRDRHPLVEHKPDTDVIL